MCVYRGNETSDYQKQSEAILAQPMYAELCSFALLRGSLCMQSYAYINCHEVEQCIVAAYVYTCIYIYEWIACKLEV